MLLMGNQAIVNTGGIRVNQDVVMGDNLQSSLQGQVGHDIPSTTSLLWTAAQHKVTGSTGD